MDVNTLLLCVLVSCSVKPKPREREYVVPLIRQNKWRLPAKKGGEGLRQGEEKSEEEVALEKEAAEAIMKGEVMSNEVSPFLSLHHLQYACDEDFQVKTLLGKKTHPSHLFLPPSLTPSSLTPSIPPSLTPSIPPSLTPTLSLTDIQEAKLQGLEPQDSGLVVPLIMQNKPPVVEGREGDELADVELRPEQVTVCVAGVRRAQLILQKKICVSELANFHPSYIVQQMTYLAITPIPFNSKLPELLVLLLPT